MLEYMETARSSRSDFAAARDSRESHVECDGNKGAQVRSLTQSEIPLEAVAKVRAADLQRSVWKVANVKDICADPPRDIYP
jgi:hypothetical protein